MGVPIPLTNSLEETDAAVLKRDLPDAGLRTGDIGPIVHRYDPRGYEVEFVTGGGDTIAVGAMSETRPARLKIRRA